MTNFIKKIFENKIDEKVHNQFVRFSKGVFEKRAAISFKTNGKVRLSTGFELTNDMVELFASIAGNFKASGILLTIDDPKEFEIEGKKKKGIFQADITDKEMSAEDIRKISEKAYFMLLDCSASGIELKIKKKLPKPGKSAAAKVNDTFCVMDADKRFEKQIIQDFLFDIQQCKKAKIVHTYHIDEIIMPTGEKDFEEIRKKAKRKGRIIRIINADGKEKTEQRDFAA